MNISIMCDPNSIARSRGVTEFEYTICNDTKRFVVPFEMIVHGFFGVKSFEEILMKQSTESNVFLKQFPAIRLMFDV